jgi:cell division protein FtsW
MITVTSNKRQPGQIIQLQYFGDANLWLAATLLMVFGLVMMTSASIEIANAQYNDAFYYLKRQLRFLAMGLVAGLVVINTPLRWWKQCSGLLYFLAVLMLILVLIPGIGREVNGSMRWLNLGVINIQASELAKLMIIVFIAAFTSRNRIKVTQSLAGFVSSLVFLGIPVVLLLKEPDFGAVVVLSIAVFGMLFMSGVRLTQFLFILLSASAVLGVVVFSAEYRVERLKSFMAALANPFSEEVVFGTGYQLAQALIGFGRGEWLGMGLGNSIQKLYFLPEAHTDFVLAIIAEELGFLAMLALMALFAMLIHRAMMIGRMNDEHHQHFAAYVAYGIAFIFTAQVLINIAVNVGLLPTKGLTLPFISYGGSSLIICIVMIALLLRIDMEHHVLKHQQLVRESRQ